MKKLFLITMLLILPIYTFACPITLPDQIIGYYSYKSGEGYFEDFSLEDKHVFKSWINSRPEYTSLKWDFSKSECRVRITGETLTLPIMFRIIKNHKGTLVVQFENSEKNAIYKQILN